MKFSVRLGFVVALALVLSAAVWPIAADRPALQPSDLTVHEWGTFTSVAGKDGSAIEWDTLGCKDDLPGFVNDFGFRGLKWRLGGTVRMETPVIYFYSPRDVVADVRISFPHGLITEWYPQARVRRVSDERSQWRTPPAGEQPLRDRRVTEARHRCHRVEPDRGAPEHRSGSAD